jgi:hypothetical protein
MFGNLDGRYADGFAQLAELDQDLDGTVSPQEASLLVWRDANANGVTDSGELLPVDFSVPATAGQVSMVSGGNRIPKVAYAGSVLVGDALLHDAPHARLR